MKDGESSGMSVYRRRLSAGWKPIVAHWHSGHNLLRAAE